MQNTVNFLFLVVLDSQENNATKQYITDLNIQFWQDVH